MGASSIALPSLRESFEKSCQAKVTVFFCARVSRNLVWTKLHLKHLASGEDRVDDFAVHVR